MSESDTWLLVGSALAEVCPWACECLGAVLWAKWWENALDVVGRVVVGKAKDEMFTEDYCTRSDIEVLVIFLYNAGEEGM